MKINYKVKELIEALKDMPQGAEVQLDCEGAMYDELHVEQVGKRVVIFSQGESNF